MKTDTSVTFLLIRVQIQTKETKKKNPQTHRTKHINKKDKINITILRSSMVAHEEL